MDRFELVAEQKGCEGSDAYKGRIATLEKCAEKCLNVASMFSYAREGTSFCNSYGCACACEPSASVDGTCKQIELDPVRLYRFIQKGDILSVERCFDISILHNERRRSY